MAVKHDERARGNLPAPVTTGNAPASRASGDTLPPTPFATLLAEGGADLVVLSTDVQLIDTVRRAVRERLPVSTATGWAELETVIASSRRTVVLIDADFLSDAAGARIDTLMAYSHKVVTLVAADRLVAQGLMGFLSDRRIHRLLIKPPAPGITRLLIDSAIARCLQLEEVEPPREPVTEPPRAPVVRRNEHPPFWVFAAAGAALLTGVIVIASVPAWWRPPPESVASDAPPPGVALLARDGSPVQLQSAAMLPREEPSSAEQLDRHLATLAADPHDQAAHQQLAALVGVLYARAEAALLNHDHETAAAALADVRRAEPASGRLKFLEAQLSRSAAPPLAHRQEPQAVALLGATTELESLLTIARARIERGELLDPAGEGASEYLDRAERIAPDDARVAAIRNELSAAFVAAARSALAQRNLDKASAFAAEAHRRGADPARALDSELAQLRDEHAMQRRAAWLALANDRIRQGALTAPVDDHARHYLSLLQREAPELEGLDAAWTAFSEAIAGRTEVAVARRDWSTAEEGLAALQAAPHGASTAERLRAQLDTRRLEEQYLAVAMPASELELLERVALAYPVEAERRGIEGWVEVEFVVDITGRPGQLEVVAANPEGEFERAALATLAKYRYRPFLHEGKPFARRARQRLRFALE